MKISSSSSGSSAVLNWYSTWHDGPQISVACLCFVHVASDRMLCGGTVNRISRCRLDQGQARERRLLKRKARGAPRLVEDAENFGPARFCKRPGDLRIW